MPKFIEKYQLIIFLLILFIGAGLGFVLAEIINNSQNSAPATQNSYRIDRQTGFTLTNPLLDCQSNTDSSFSNIQIQKLKTSLSSYINTETSKDYLNHVSIYYRDLNNGPWFGINEKEKFSPASLLKVPVMLYFYKQAETNPDILETLLEFNLPDDDVNQNIKPSITLIHGKKYTIEELIGYMIAYSDNNAKNMLVNIMDRKMLDKTYVDLGLIPPVPNSPDDFMNVVDYASFFRVLYNSSYLSRTYSEKALSLLTRSEYKDGLSAGIPRGITIAHKFGERKILPAGIRQLHDCGVIYNKTNPYLLCVMTRGSDFEQLASVIREISRITYTAVNSPNN